MSEGKTLDIGAKCIYNMTNYEWDQAKREVNLNKHGVDFADIEYFQWDSAIVGRSDRQGETRYIGVGLLQGRLHVVVFTDRDNKTRIISLRRANQEERLRYAATIY